LAGEPTNYNLVELVGCEFAIVAPGATDIQTDLDKVMQQWVLQKQTFIRKLVRFMLVGKFTKLEVAKARQRIELKSHRDEGRWE